LISLFGVVEVDDSIKGVFKNKEKLSFSSVSDLYGGIKGKI